jgi:diguanylate cyclase (GGDEF)-like protein
MKSFRDTNIAIKLGGAFGLVLLLLAAVIVLTLVELQRLRHSSEALVEGGLRKAAIAHTAQNAAQAGAARLHSLFLLDERDARVPVYAAIDRNTATRDQAISALASATDDKQERLALVEVKRARDHFAASFNDTVDQVEMDAPQAKLLMLRDTMPALDGMLESLDALVTLQARRVDSEIAAIRATQADSERLIVLLGLSAVLAGCLSAFAITRAIVVPLAGTVAFADAIAAGRLDETLPLASGDEVGTLVGALDRMRHGIVAREAKITTLAYNDPLTGLPNRALFNDRLEQAVSTASRAGHPLSVLIIDLDRFRHVNDILGHHVGDELLKDVATRLRAVMQRDSDTVARLGADEFAVLLPTQGRLEAQLVAKQVLRALETPMSLRDQRVDIGASIGMACYPEHAMTARALVSRADLAMYVAKRENSGLVLFDGRFERDTEQTLSLMSELRRAVEHDELTLNFQPKMNLLTGLSREVEVLVRWRHPERGLVAPDQFIPFAERTGYIRSITQWVVDHACAQLSIWRKGGLEIAICINISARDLIDKDFVSVIQRALGQHGIEPDWVCLEITESAIMEDLTHALDALERLHAMGLQLSIDDFGTGYSSLAYLKRLPVGELKIDKSFVLNMTKDHDDATIVRSTIDLGHNMGLTVVAEGIEDRQCWEMLQALGCDEGQGYFFSKPLSAPQLEDWFRRQNAAVQASESDATFLLAATAEPEKGVPL